MLIIKKLNLRRSLQLYELACIIDIKGSHVGITSLVRMSLVLNAKDCFSAYQIMTLCAYWYRTNFYFK